MLTQTKNSALRSYDAAAVASFRKTNERFGGLSNMAPGYPIKVGSVEVRTSEALYQACRFPNDPTLQQRVLAERSPMTAKMIIKPYRNLSREDWDAARLGVMRWCLKLKLLQNWNSFGHLLDLTEELDIVEHSRRDQFWATTLIEGRLVGQNVLGRMLMELRLLKTHGRDALLPIRPPKIANFRLLGCEIKAVDENGRFVVDKPAAKAVAYESESKRTLLAESSTPYRGRIFEVIKTEVTHKLVAPLSVKELAARLNVTPSQMQSWLKILVEDGLVTKEKGKYSLCKGVWQLRVDQLSLLPT